MYNHLMYAIAMNQSINFMQPFFRLVVILIILSLAACQSQPAPALPDVSQAGETLSSTAYLPSSPMPTDSIRITVTPTPPATLPSTATNTPLPTSALPLVQLLPFTPPPGLSTTVTIQIFELRVPLTPKMRSHTEMQAILKNLSLFAPKTFLEYWSLYRNERLPGINEMLAPFDYTLRERGNINDPFGLFDGQKPLLFGSLASSPSVNRSHSDFVMFMHSYAAGKTYIIRKGGIEALTTEQYFRYAYGRWPQFFGDDLLYAASESNPNGPSPVINLFLNEELIYTAPPPNMIYVQPAIHDLTVYDDAGGAHWCLEILNQLHIDGLPVNETYGYQNSYEFHLLGGKLVFMFEKDGSFGLNIAGQEMFLPGDSVPHYACCVPEIDNPTYTDHALAFFLKSGEGWKYVEVLVP